MFCALYTTYRTKPVLRSHSLEDTVLAERIEPFLALELSCGLEF